ncbi:hypothetical protein SERLA73DRAFT_186357 [Serpula lacrymans var. lacrymans S7.3]|uniref:MARVEL domain-containing protein n=2 Tax=Serpula lacrymans var. lacrymans TaxID=341189 RepID=F8Q757_SERL3|nr:uncharacterized protein SERLADRAFT_475349 [Serpula lacrymans var. lacrymans S7.9]EGN95395.1 hypothetical protein SERLA73DRAFT_186357 [Serpula lacrymans var. lacrymans S7.3]EGO20929.1 hypothetical protein SERLADRAFT_475349 [Serpula lacrymans var. lacrymans S7.9]
MRSTLLLVRYLVFGLFIICNAVVCSAAVWNRSLVPAEGQMMQIDIYLIFLGALGIVFIFSIIFLEILSSNHFTGLVWFECTWIVLFWLLELAGAAAITAVSPGWFCGSGGSRSLCVSTQVLQAFTWICTITMLAYVCFLMLSIISHYKTDPDVWHLCIRNLKWSQTRQCLRSMPNSPVSSGFKTKAPVTFAAPLPRRPVPNAIYTHRVGLSSEYEIELFGDPCSPSVETFTASPMAIMVPPALPPPARVHHPRSSDAAVVEPAPSLYPISMQSHISSHRKTPSLPATPSPLGEWPRSNALDQTTTSRANRVFPPTSFTFPSNTRTSSEVASAETAPSSSSQNLLPRTRKPSGPRSRSSSTESQHKPPPLDLSSVSAFKEPR